MSKPTLLDTNVLIYHLGGHPVYGKKAQQIMTELLTHELVISVITEVEFLFKCTHIEANIFRVLFPQDSILPISESISARLPDVCLRGPQRVKIPDALIAATALVHGLPLLTFDHDFLSIPALTFHPLSPVFKP